MFILDIWSLGVILFELCTFFSTRMYVYYSSHIYIDTYIFTFSLNIYIGLICVIGIARYVLDIWSLGVILFELCTFFSTRMFAYSGSLYVYIYIHIYIYVLTCRYRYSQICTRHMVAGRHSL